MYGVMIILKNLLCFKKNSMMYPNWINVKTYNIPKRRDKPGSRFQYLISHHPLYISSSPNKRGLKKKV